MPGREHEILLELFRKRPRLVPVVTDRALAREAPELALLSVLAHGKSAVGFPVAMAAFTGLGRLDKESAVLYFDVIWKAVSVAVRSELEELMRIDGYEFQSDFAKKYISLGREEGHAAGQAEALLRVLAARGLEASESQRSRILSCTDSETLADWLDRAPHVEQVEQLLQ